jgi:septin family protein
LARKLLSSYLEGDVKLMVMGNTNVGKSTFLNGLLGIGSFLLTNEDRETSCFWNVKVQDPNRPDPDAEYFPMSQVQRGKEEYEFRALFKQTEYDISNIIEEKFADKKDLRLFIKKFKADYAKSIKGDNP